MPNEQASPRALVVDDEKLVADTLVLILRSRGYDAQAVYCGEDAAAFAIESKPDIVITDVVMGPMDGVALAIYLAQVLPSCRVVLMSGNMAAGSFISDAANRGQEFPVLAKPFPPDSLLLLIGEAASKTLTEA